MDFYNCVSELGKGTFGVVYLAERKHNGHKIVIKEIITDLKTEELKCVKNEVAILRSMNHPNIIQYYDSFFKRGTFSIVMEYASKGTLHDLINKKRTTTPLSPQAVMNLFCQILNGLDHIHSKKIIHRDLKCENIFLSGIEGDVVKIGDFGISKMIINNKKAKTVIGTYNYFAPELCDDKSYDNKIDIWSLGCILYELCALEKMFDGSLSQIIMSITSGKLKQIEAETYGHQMQELIISMMQMDPQARPDTKKLLTHPDIFPTSYCVMCSLGCIF